MSKTGRNDLCHCGSGKKFKKCHGEKAAAAGGHVMLLLVGAAILAAIVVGITSFTGEPAAGARQVWSTEHGHYHSATGGEIP